ncbi:unnamed protein product [Microthlaspi erraticum]|uniref:Uncharacterized protein n=1 Tax=Microthlaspi erraticum TaxID=1685480 RepID=A0A6D2J8Y4_9BRAS|nr:unnamed protein product [Microthlaspi erraticum]
MQYGKQIEKIKKSGVEITDMILSPEIAFTGDTTAEYMLDPRNADALRAKVLISENPIGGIVYHLYHIIASELDLSGRQRSWMKVLAMSMRSLLGTLIYISCEGQGESG